MLLVKNIPNLLTLSRLGLAFYFPFSPQNFRFGIILLSLITEFLDGVLARQFNWRSRVGALLDPIADKAFVFSVVITMFINSHLLWWQLILIGVRDIIVFFGALTLIFQHNYKAFLHVRPHWSGKVCTAIQFLLLGWFFYFNELPVWLLYSTWIVSLVAGADYLILLFQKNFYEEYKR